MLLWKRVIQTFCWWFNVRFYNRVVKQLAEFFKGLGNFKAESILFVVCQSGERGGQLGYLHSRLSAAGLVGFFSLDNPPFCNLLHIKQKRRNTAHGLEELLVPQERCKLTLSSPHPGKVICSHKFETKSLSVNRMKLIWRLTPTILTV